MRVLMGLAVIGLVVASSSPGSAAQPWSPDKDACNAQSTTVAIVECIEGRTRVWDGRLNQAYKAVLAMLAADPASKPQAAQLVAAQRLWLQYRKANCAYYALGQGTITQIEVAGCEQRMTQDRAIELQAAGPQG